MAEYTPLLKHRFAHWPIRLLLIIAVLALIAVGVGIWFYRHLSASLAQLDGTATLADLSAPVTVARDAQGVPTVRAANRLDVARATGFLHAQERFFQMDLLRRKAAGELAELVSNKALAYDRQVRVHRFRARAQDTLSSLPGAQRRVIEAYTAGVNAGLTALAAAPFEYALLGAKPAPWRPADTLLAGYAMYLDLQATEIQRESVYGVLHDVLPPALYAFLTPVGTEWDAPLLGQAFATPPPPGPEVFDARQQPPLLPPLFDYSATPVLGSNNWAVAGAHTAHGGALLAVDMHLKLRAPNVWYRISLVFPDASGRPWQVTGVTLPGTPAIVVGSNGHVAWGFTNSQGDWLDLVELESAGANAYLTPDGPQPFQRRQEIIRVKNGDADTLEVLETIWGPVIDADHRGRLRALRWIAHDRGAMDMTMMNLETADSIEAAIAIANQSGAPAQNFVVAGADGRVGWSILGPIPRRFGHSGRLPSSWADGQRGWHSRRAPEEYPRIIEPASGRLWTANARTVDGEWLALLGDGGYALGARARQIRDALLTLKQADEIALLALQLDDRAVFLQRWRDLLLATLDAEALAADPRRQAVRDSVENWGGRAAIDSVGYRLVREFRLTLAAEVFAPLTAACYQADARCDYAWVRQQEGPLWRLVSEQPAHLLNPNYASWHEQLLAAADTLLERTTRNGAELIEHTWGEYNTVHVRHPLSAAIPVLEWWLDMPVLPLPGDTFMPRVQTPRAGASQRMVVAPGREAQGIFHMPGGQSGHPLSPFYRTGHRAWAAGEPNPLLPGPTVYTLTLRPKP